MKRFLKMFPLFLIAGCAGFQRSCASGCAGTLGADWLVVQLRADGSAVNCWKLPDVSMSNEQASDGVYWQDVDGHLVHISGWYNRVQVKDGAWENAAKSVGVDIAKCVGGKYTGQ